MHQVNGHGICSALFIARVKLAEFLGPGFSGQIESANFISSEGVLEVCWEIQLTSFNILSKELACAMAKQLVQSDDQSQRIAVILNVEVYIFLLEELYVRSLSLRVSIAQVDVLEAFVHTDVIIVRDVNAYGHSGASKGQHV